MVWPGADSPVEEHTAPPIVVDKGEATPSRHSGLWFSHDEKKPADGSSKGSCASPKISPGLPFLSLDCARSHLLAYAGNSHLIAFDFAGSVLHLLGPT